VKLRIIIIGIIFVLFAIPGYTILPSVITHETNNLTGGNLQSPLTKAMLAQMGIPSIDTIIKLTQYCFVGLAVAGLGIIVLGVLSKKIPKQTPIKVQREPSSEVPDEGNPNELRLLQERLAKGEISSSQYQNLKKLLEDKL
jgi:uncharacterized membrane protein